MPITRWTRISHLVLAEKCRSLSKLVSVALVIILMTSNWFFGVCITCSSYCNDFIFLSLQILDEMPVFYNLNAVEKREVLIVVLQIVRNMDDTSLVKAWQQSIARTRLFFKLLEECLILFEVLMYFDFYLHLTT